MERKAFENKVTFNVTGNNMKGIVVTNGMRRTIHEWVTFEGDEAILFSNLTLFLSRTKDISADTNETDENILALMRFWEMAQIEADYRRIWNEFLYLDPVINNEWIGVMNASEMERLKAPLEVRPDSESDEVLEDAAPQKKRGVTST